MVDQVGSDINMFIDKKKQELGQLGSDFYRANVPNFTNIYQNLVAEADDATDITNLSNELPENIFGLLDDTNATVADNLNAAAEAAIGDGVGGSAYEPGTISSGPTVYPDETVESIYEPGTSEPGPTEYPDVNLGNVNEPAPTRTNENLGNVND